MSARSRGRWTASTVEAAATTLIEKHKHLGITAEAYDETINTLGETMHDWGIPRAGVEQMLPMLAELKKGLVTA